MISIGHFTFTIDDNGALAGGMVVVTHLFFNHEPLVNFSDFGADNVNLAGWNINETNVNLGQAARTTRS